MTLHENPNPGSTFQSDGPFKCAGTLLHDGTGRK